ncbi:winged helix-turn-helix transcriptional regulator [Roseomonas sp. CCTCC AB2023176]|uniref:winged helix-turn-helix transcriptional regulator n=1 Tax=Roseomonas sp. CCTCC AB2023176 TaxID=3342640 RepID=UPI0035DC97A1
MAHRHPRYDCGPGCPVEAALALIGGKWKGVVLHHLLEEGTLRFTELRRRMPGATPRVLVRQLRELEQHGLIARTIFAAVPARVEYAPTPLGRSLRPVIASLRDWGNGWLASQAAGPDVPAIRRAG